MKIWKVKAQVIPGKSYKRVNKVARSIFHKIEKRSKRKPYIKSRYFKKQKVFLSFFWEHLKSKRPKDRLRRVKLFDCGLELIKDSTAKPKIVKNPNNKKESFYRFLGVSNRDYFIVQIKKDKSNKLEFMSVFPK